MHRELSRKNKQLPFSECIEILKSEKRGVLSVNGDNGYPYAVPMNHFYNEDDGKIYFHSGKNGHRNDSLKSDNKVSFCVYDNGCVKEGDWALTVRSVIVFGKAELVESIGLINNIMMKFSRKFTSDEEYIKKEIDAFAEDTVMIVLTPENICGKAITES